MEKEKTIYPVQTIEKKNKNKTKKLSKYFDNPDNFRKLSAAPIIPSRPKRRTAVHGQLNEIEELDDKIARHFGELEQEKEERLITLIADVIVKMTLKEYYETCD